MPNIQTRNRARYPQIGANGAQKTKDFNKNLRVMQGFRSAIAASSTTNITITLNSPGLRLLGIAIYPTTAILTTLGDTQINFVVNNLNLLLGVGANSLNPNFVQNMLFLPTPQPLQGNDSINLAVIKNDAGTATILTQIFYVPR